MMNKYTRWLERKLGMARKELNTLQQMRTQPWLRGATTEWHLQKRITELESREANARALMENLMNKTEAIGDGEMIDLEDVFAEMKEWLDD